MCIRDSPQAVRGLFDLLTTSCFRAMADEYRLPISDHPWANTTLALGGTTKTVRHYQVTLESAGMKSYDAREWCPAPDVLGTIERRIDEVAGTKRWIGNKGAHDAGRR